MSPDLPSASSPSKKKKKMETEVMTFSIPHSPPERIQALMKRTDNWIPLLFSTGYDGKRITGEEGQVGAVYLASLYQGSTSFSTDREEEYEIISIKDNEIVLQYHPDSFDRFWLQYPKKKKDDPRIQLTFRTGDDTTNTISTLVRLTEFVLPHFDGGFQQYMVIACTLGLAYCETNRYEKSRQSRNDSHEELKLYFAH